MDKFTAIIPLRIDSVSRLKNVNIIISYLVKFFECDILIKEVDKEQKYFPPNNYRIKYYFEKVEDTSFFYRTKILNDMLAQVTTDYVVNYDSDILVPQLNVNKSIDMLKNGYDLVYPYELGIILLDWPLTDEQINKFLTDPNTDYLSYVTNKYKMYYPPHNPLFEGLTVFNKFGIKKIFTTGGIQFFKTESYKSGFGENEEFIDWGPEDQERLFRFLTLGYNVGWIDSGNVCHISHERSIATDENNLHNKNNHQLWENIKNNLNSKEKMLDYMKSLEYVKNNKIGIK